MIAAEVIADSVSPTGVRLTTLQVDMHRFVLPEFNTHRAFCVAGDAMIEFDLPAGSTGSEHRVHRMRIDEFVDKWKRGARRIGSNPKRASIAAINPARLYTGQEAAMVLGHANASNIHSLCRYGTIRATKLDDRRGGPWIIKGSDLIAWREAKPEHTRYDMGARLRSMRIRQLDEQTGLITTSTVVDVIESGMKPVLTIRAGRFEVAATADHLIYTPNGYRRLGELVPGDEIVVQRRGRKPSERANSTRLLKIGGVWRSDWQRRVRHELLAEHHGHCSKCDETNNLHVHHIIPVHVDQSLAFERSNVTLLCEGCHRRAHGRQGWQVTTYLYGDTVKVDSVEYRGLEPTFDLTIAGEFPNFVANGVIVHNSRNSASSRAIPLRQRIEAVRNDPAMPIEWGANQPGMQAGAQLDDVARAEAEWAWRDAARHAADIATEMAEIGLHKQVAARILEPFLWHRVVVSATDWAGFFAQRCSPLAQPEIRAVAEAMRTAMDASTPRPIEHGEWHLPYVDRHGYVPTLQAMSVARCARVSYLNEGKRDIDDDLRLYRRLLDARPVHASPFEHVATPARLLDRVPGNFAGWHQLRHTLELDRHLTTEVTS